MMEKLKFLEKIVIISLMIMMIFIVVLSTIRLGWILVEEMLKPPVMLLNIDEMLRVFGFFLMLLIGIELLESIKAYITEDVIRVEAIIAIALIAIARKVIVLDLTKLPSLTLIGIASILIALSAGYFLIRRAIDMSKQR
jgi:uncharacterized membrane protein (DUF373 family)